MIINNSMILKLLLTSISGNITRAIVLIPDNKAHSLDFSFMDQIF